MAVSLRSLSAREMELNCPRQGRAPALPGAAQGRPRGRQAAVGRAATLGMGAGPQEGNEGMRVGKQSPHPALPRPSACLSARGDQEKPRGTAGSCSSASTYLKVESIAQATHVRLWRKQEDTPEAGF